MNITLPGKAAGIMASQREQAEKQRARLDVEARSWYRISNAADPDEAEVMLYDEIGGWFGSTADELIAELRQVSAPRMRVRVNSPGGSVFEGIAIANALRSHPASVTVQVDGIAASIASVIAMAGDRIEMAPNTMMMIHDASGLAMGNAADMEEMAELLDVISDNIADAYAARAGGTRDDWRARMRSESWYLPEDAVDAGLADEAVEFPKSGKSVPAPVEEPEPEMRQQFDLAAYGYTGPRGATDEPVENPPAPGGSASHPEVQPTLTISLADLLDEEAIARLRAAVHPPAADPETPAVPETPTVTDTAGPDAEPEPPADPWAAAVARLAQPQADPWATAVARFTSNTASSSAATEAA
ncbi:head maturation protease, ClpP-related [Streptomyces sp. NPDC058534]|uniref:head maturation protease, ClpP-related n=1 Tax=Streptomyces sp. NPDC058534 TaxID=3346541 RepID=UPI003665F4D6